MGLPITRRDGGCLTKRADATLPESPLSVLAEANVAVQSQCARNGLKDSPFTWATQPRRARQSPLNRCTPPD